MDQSTAIPAARTTGSAAGAFRGLPPTPRFAQLPTTGDALFDRAIRVVFHHEGFWSDDPDDPGGPTIWGVSLRWARTIGDLDGDGFADLDFDHDGDVDAVDLRQLTAGDALALYRRLWWERYGYARLPDSIAIKTFDLAVNMGARQAHKLLQRAVRASSHDRLIEDGLIGARTVKAVRAAVPFALMPALRSESAGFYRSLIARRPASAKYEAGWLNRAYY